MTITPQLFDPWRDTLHPLLRGAGSGFTCFDAAPIARVALTFREASGA